MRTRSVLITGLALAGLAACDDQAGPAPAPGHATGTAAAQAAGAAAPKAAGVQLPKSTQMLPIPQPPTVGAWDGDEDDAEVELYSTVITAVDCAKKMAEAEDPAVLSKCSPLDAARSGFAVYDPAGEELYLLDPKSFHQFELERGFAGSMDISGTIIGAVGELPVLKPEDYTITPKPPPGAFKGCL